VPTILIASDGSPVAASIVRINREVGGGLAMHGGVSGGPRIRRWLLVILLLGVVTVASSCGRDEDPAFVGTVVDPPFTISGKPLTTTDGKPFSFSDDLDHRMNIVFFGYTRCPDICPAVLGSLASGLLKLDAADRKQVAVYFVTTDPKRDSDAVLERYLGHFDPSFVGLRGNLDDIVDVGKSVGVYVDQGTPIAGGGYDPNAHGTYVIGVERQGDAPVFWGMDTAPSQFAGDLESMLNG